MLLLALRSFFFVAVVMGYSTGVWRLINDYFRQEFKTYLDDEVKKNKYLVEDPVGTPSVPVTGVPVESEPKQPIESATSNRLLDELIVNFGRLFTAGNPPLQATRKESESNRIQSVSTPPPQGQTTTTAGAPRIPADRNDNFPDPGGGGDGGDDVGSDQIGKGSKGQQIEFTPPSAPAGSSSTIISSSRSFGAKVDAKTIIESDEFPRSSTSRAEHHHHHQATEAEAEEDGEDQWVQYWKNRVVLNDDDDGDDDDDAERWGQCAGPPPGDPNNGPLIDGCELNLVPRG